MIRRSKRTNKGQHSSRATDDVYYISDEEEPQPKKFKSDDEYSDVEVAEPNQGRDEQDDELEEEEDEVVEISKPVVSKAKPKPKPKKPVKTTEANEEEGEFSELNDTKRISVAKFFLKTLKNQIPSNYDKDLSNDQLAYNWAKSLEESVWKNFPQHYSDKARAIPGLIKKPEVLNKLLSKELSCDQMVSLKPEQAIQGLNDIAEKVKLESIRRSVLKADEGQRIRRTHKGEEIVEDVSRDHKSEENQVNIVSKSVDHRIFDEKSKSEVETVRKTSLKPENDQSYNYQADIYFSDVEVVDESDEETQGENIDPSTTDTSTTTTTKNESALDDDTDLDKILGTVSPPPPSSISPKKSAMKKQELPNIKSSEVWNGTLTFPDFVTFEPTFSLVSATGYKAEISSANDVNIHNRYVEISQDILTKKYYEVEGKLDKSKAEPYLNQVINSRDLIIYEVKSKEHGYEKLLDYLLRHGKVGVLSGKPKFVKDAYLIGLDGYSVPAYLKGLDNLKSRKGLFALYVVQRNYEPGTKPAPNLPSKPKARPASELNSILSNLGSF